MATMIPESSSNQKSSRGTPPRKSQIVQSRSKSVDIEGFFHCRKQPFVPIIPIIPESFLSSKADGCTDDKMLEYVFF